MTTDMWSAYVRRLLALSELNEANFLKSLTVQQGTFNRWKTGASVPARAGDVAQFATECGRNVLEAFVAAGMLTEDDAGRGLPAASRRFLAEVRGEVVTLPVSEPTSNVDIAIAAHEDGSIAGEQESTNET